MAIRGEYAVRESITNMRRNFFVTFAAVLVVAISLTLFGSVLLLRNAITRSTNLVTRQVEVAVFLNKDVSADERKQIESDLRAMPEVSLVKYESKQEAYANFRTMWADVPEMVANTSPDVLPESYRVKLTDPEKFGIIRDRLEGRPGITEIRDDRQTLHAYFSVANTLRLGGLIIAIVIGVAALVLIATTIRMAIHARRKEISIMKLVGATNWFIRVPFMLEGVVQGLIGSAVAFLFLLATHPILSSSLAKQFSHVGFQITFGDVLTYGVYILFAGAVFGGLGSLAGLRRFLDV